MSRLAAADLDHDGRPEIAVGYGAANGSFFLALHDATGALRPGWPMFDAGRLLAIGDLDRDGQSELVTAGATGFFVARANGSRLPGAWPSDRQYATPLVADVDGDTFPEVVIASTTSVTPIGARAYGDTRIEAFDRNGNLVRQWPTFGLGGKQPRIPAPVAGELTGDGKTDVGLLTPLLRDPTFFGVNFYAGGALSVLTTGTTFRAATADWPTADGDAGNNGVPAVPPVVAVAPVADAHVFDGDKSANFGGDGSLVVRNSPGGNYVSYLRFPLGGVDKTITSARLRLFGSRFGSSNKITVSAFAVTSNSWGEFTITWNNKPSLGARQGSPLVTSKTEQFHEWDVTAFVKSQKAAGATAVSLAVKMDSSVGSDAADVFDSRDSSRPPRPWW